jgi:hypothetical protein
MQTYSSKMKRITMKLYPIGINIMYNYYIGIEREGESSW